MRNFRKGIASVKLAWNTRSSSSNASLASGTSDAGALLVNANGIADGHMRRAIKIAWDLLRESVVGFVADNALSHGAAMAFYATTSLAPSLLIVVAIASLAFGHEAAQLALSAQISGMIGSRKRKSPSNRARERVGQIIRHLGGGRRHRYLAPDRIWCLWRNAAVVEHNMEG